MSTSGEIGVQTELHPTGRWITVPIQIGPLDLGSYTIAAVLDTGAPVSAISPRVEQELLARGLLNASALPHRYLLNDLTALGQRLPSLDVGVVGRLDRLGVDGLLGLDFLARFVRIQFDTRSLWLVLERP